MTILGIDPGTTRIGFAAIRTGAVPRLLQSDVIQIAPGESDQRILGLHRALRSIIRTWNPGVLATEKLFFAKNAKTALAVSEARGAILLTAALAGIKVYEYTPLEVKKAVTGYGKADKLQVEKMVRLVFPELVKTLAHDDMFDAIAIAYTCYLTRFRSRPLDPSNKYYVNSKPR